MLAAQPPIPLLASSERPRGKDTVAFLPFSPEKQLEVYGFYLVLTEVHQEELLLSSEKKPP